MIALLVALQGPPIATVPWRVVNLPWLHLGVRPYVYLDSSSAEVGVTMQLTTNAP